MERRTIIKGAAGIGAASTAGVTGLVFMSGAGAAAVDVGTVEFSADKVEGSSDDGTLTGIDVWVSGEFAWENFSNEAANADILLEVAPQGSENFEEITSDESAGLSGVNGDGTFDLSGIPGDILDHTELSDGDFESTQDGVVVENDAMLRLTVTVNDGEGNSEVAQEEAALTVAMLNEDLEVGMTATAEGEVKT